MLDPESWAENYPISTPKTTPFLGVLLTTRGQHRGAGPHPLLKVGASGSSPTNCYCCFLKRPGRVRSHTLMRCQCLLHISLRALSEQEKKKKKEEERAVWVPLREKVEKEIFISLIQAEMGHQHKSITKLDGFSHLLGKQRQALCLVPGAGGTDSACALSSS